MNTTKLPSAQLSPLRSWAAIVAKPWASQDWSVGWAVIEFHSEMLRSHRAAPLEEVGEIEPNVASWRAHQGPITTKNPTSARNPANHEIGWRSSTWLQPRPPRRARHQRTRSASHTRPTAPASRTPSLRARDARPARNPATANDRPSPRRPRAT